MLAPRRFGPFLAFLALCGTLPATVLWADGPAPAPPPPPAPAPAAPAAAPPAAPAGPHGRVEFDREEQDFGVARQEEELRTEFLLKNTGDAALKISDVRADCGCAAATVEGREVEPGGSMTIRVALRTLTMSGLLHKRIRVMTDDPKRPVAELQLKVDVAAGIVLDPARFFFGDVPAGTAPSTTMLVKWKDGIGKAFRLTGVEAPGIDVDFTTKPYEAPPWRGYEITATFRSPPKVGTVGATALIRTDDPDYPRLTAAIQAFVSGKVWVDKRAVSLGMVPAGKGRQVAVTVRGFAKGDDLGEVTAKSRKGRVTVQAVRSGREWIVMIRLPEDAPSGKVEDVVDIGCALPGEPPAEVVVSGFVGGAR